MGVVQGQLLAFIKSGPEGCENGRLVIPSTGCSGWLVCWGRRRTSCIISGQLGCKVQNTKSDRYERMEVGGVLLLWFAKLVYRCIICL